MKTKEVILISTSSCTETACRIAPAKIELVSDPTNCKSCESIKQILRKELESGEVSIIPDAQFEDKVLQFNLKKIPSFIIDDEKVCDLYVKEEKGEKHKTILCPDGEQIVLGEGEK